MLYEIVMSYQTNILKTLDEVIVYVHVCFSVLKQYYFTLKTRVVIPGVFLFGNF